MGSDPEPEFEYPEENPYNPRDPDYVDAPRRYRQKGSLRVATRMRSVLANRKCRRKGRKRCMICTVQGCTRVRDTADDNSTYQRWTFAKCPYHQRQAWNRSKRHAKQLKMAKMGLLPKHFQGL